MPNRAERLLELAKAEFPDLTGPETKLIESAAPGEIADYLSPNEEENDPERYEGWGKERTLRAAVVAWLCADPAAQMEVHHRGVQITGARLRERLSLSFASVPFPVALLRCAIPDGVGLMDARTRGLFLNGSRTGPIGADRLNADGPIYLRDGFHASGVVRLLGARIGGDLNCRKGRFENKDGDALLADRAEVTGNVRLSDGFHATGVVRLIGTWIGGDLNCSQGRFENKDGDAIHAQRMAVEGGWVLRRLAAKPEGRVNMAHARISVIVDDETGWPAPGNLILDGLVYDSFGGAAPRDADSRLRWVGLQSSDPMKFRTQPYEQLIKVFRAAGQEDDANRVAIAKRIAMRANRTKLREPPKWNGGGGVTLKGLWQAFLSWVGFRLYRMWNVFLEKMAGYGYKPERLWMTLVLLLLSGAGIFTAAYRADALYPIERVRYEIAAGNPLPRAYPEFYGLVYSLDVLVPFFDLNQERYWVVRSDHSFSFFLHVYEWFHILTGWVITGLLLASPTRLLRKD